MIPDGTSIKYRDWAKVKDSYWLHEKPGLDGSLIEIEFDRNVDKEWSKGDYITYDPRMGIQLVIEKMYGPARIVCKVLATDIKTAYMPIAALQKWVPYIKVGSSSFTWASMRFTSSKLPVTGKTFEGL